VTGNGPHLRLRVLDEGSLDDVLPWFDDPATQTSLGGRDWIQRALRLMQTQPGSADGDRVVEDRFVWIAYEDEWPVALGGRRDLQRRCATFAVVVAPDLRGRGLCPRLMRIAMSHPRVVRIRTWYSDVDSDNEASARCLTSVGFREVPDGSDEASMIRYELAV
jgi:RimJ/RimL family protein N-acetyltransferase